MEALEARLSELPAKASVTRLSRVQIIALHSCAAGSLALNCRGYPCMSIRCLLGPLVAPPCPRQRTPLLRLLRMLPRMWPPWARSVLCYSPPSDAHLRSLRLLLYEPNHAVAPTCACIRAAFPPARTRRQICPISAPTSMSCGCMQVLAHVAGTLGINKRAAREDWRRKILQQASGSDEGRRQVGACAAALCIVLEGSQWQAWLWACSTC
jgi:hypothetical protein